MDSNQELDQELDQELGRELDQDDLLEVTVGHRPWFKRGDRLRWDELEAYDRTWPTVPRENGLASFLHDSFDLTLLLHCMWIIALVGLLLT